jgi:glycosyltransferase involved in cell wall biosynthesis
MTKTVWIIDQYALTPTTGMGGGARHYYIAKELAKLGVNVYVIAAGYHHLLRQAPVIKNKFEIEGVDGFKMVWVKLPKYKNAHDKKRILNWFLFGMRIRKLTSLIKDKPNAILASSPSPFVFLPAKYLAKKVKSKLLFEVRDIWPLTLMYLGGYSKNHPFIRIMQKVEDMAYRQSDLVLSNLPFAVDHMESRGMDKSKFRWIPNGFSNDDSVIQEDIGEEVMNKIPKDKFIVGYCGTHGIANSLDYFIEAAKMLRNYKDLLFVLVGNGKEKERLKKKVDNFNLDNVLFFDSVRKHQVQSVLNIFDVCYIGWNKEPLYKFGIAPNKIPEYMLAEKPILHSYTGKGDSVKEANAGISVEAENPDAISNAILEFKTMKKSELKQLGLNGKEYAQNNFDYQLLAEKMQNVLFN